MRFSISIIVIIGIMFILVSCGGRMGKDISYNHERLILDDGRFVYGNMYETGKIDISEIRIELENGEYLVGDVFIDIGEISDSIWVENIRIVHIYNRSLVRRYGEVYGIERVVLYKRGKRRGQWKRGIWEHHFIRYIEIEIDVEFGKIISGYYL